MTANQWSTKQATGNGEMFQKIHEIVVGREFTLQAWVKLRNATFPHPGGRPMLRKRLGERPDELGPTIPDDDVVPLERPLGLRPL